MSGLFSRLVYKIDAKTKRRKYFEGALPSKTVDLNMCSDDGRGSWTYRPDSLDEIGYVSEVATTTTYLILIENPYVFNPCALMDKARASMSAFLPSLMSYETPLPVSAPKPFLSTWFTWKGTQVPLKIHLIKKNDGTLKTTGSVPSAAFVSSTVRGIFLLASSHGSSGPLFRSMWPKVTDPRTTGTSWSTW